MRAQRSTAQSGRTEHLTVGIIVGRIIRKFMAHPGIWVVFPLLHITKS